MSLVGETLAGRYRLEQTIGSGAMSTVYRGRDVRLGRRVAVKVLRPEYAEDDAFLRRFALEARSAASIAHPNVVPIFDWGEDSSGPFLVMELVDGPSIAHVLSKRGRLPAGEAVWIAAGAASGLDAAHRRGIIHRDVKPANILLDRSGRPRVVDFGIARALTQATVTATGLVLGSIPYLSPEQARGEPTTRSSDIFALGIVLYEMLTGVRPFDVGSPAASVVARLQGPPPAPSLSAPDLPPGLDAIVMRALAPEPRDRYPNAHVLAQALAAWRRGWDAQVGHDDEHDELLAADDAAMATAGANAAGGRSKSEAADDRERSGAGRSGAVPADVPTVTTPAVDERATARDAASRDGREQAAGPSPSSVAGPPPAERASAPRRASAAAAAAAAAGAAAADSRAMAPPPKAPVRNPARATPAARPGPAAGAIRAGALRPADVRAVRMREGAPRPAARRSSDDRRRLLGPLLLVGAFAAVAVAVFLLAGTALRPGPSASGGVIGGIATPASTTTSPVASQPSPTIAPTGSPTPTVGPTAMPTPAATAPPTPRQTAPPTPRPTVGAVPPPGLGPADTVQAFYALVSQHRFAEAAALWSPRMQQAYPPAENIDSRFADTTGITIRGIATTRQTASTANVAVDLIENRDVAPVQREIVGSWDLVKQQGRWYMDAPHF